MKKVKKVFIVLAAVALISVPVGAYAATSDSDIATNFRGICGLGVDTSNLTEEQIEDLDITCDEIMDKENYQDENGYGMMNGNGMMNQTDNCQGTTQNTDCGCDIRSDRN